jgi:glycosyltransferase involved in cell wall biosynthesis
MKILLCHNFYQQRGGEDFVFADEGALLERHGHDVVRFSLHNDAIRRMNRLTVTRNTVWNSTSHAGVGEQVRRFRPDVVHFHNTFPLLSPAAYYAARHEHAAVVQTLHNYRLICPDALFFRDGRICEDCLRRRVLWPAVAHACYRGSRPATGAVTVMLTIHRLAGTWKNAVDAYIALTDFARRKFIEGGLPASKIHVKPNFVYPDPGIGSGTRDYAIFVGRLSPEKGVRTLLAAWEKLNGKIPLKIVGDGPMAPYVRQMADQLKGVEWLGQRSLQETYELIGGAMFLIFPSEWYETFGRVAIEAFSKGTPVLASNLGAMAELVNPDRTGLLFPPGDADGLVAAVARLADDRGKLTAMSAAARAEFEGKYMEEQNRSMLEDVYKFAIAARRLGQTPAKA